MQVIPVKPATDFPGGCHSEQKETARSCSIQLHRKSVCFACHVTLTFAQLLIWIQKMLSKCVLSQRQNSIWGSTEIHSKWAMRSIKILMWKWSASAFLFSTAFKYALLHGCWHEIYRCNKGGFVSLSEGPQSSVSASNEIQQNQPQALHYALANAQQVQIHQIGEDGQVQVVCTQPFLNYSV